MSDSDDSLPFLDLENISDTDEAPAGEARAEKSNQPVASTSNEEKMSISQEGLYDVVEEDQLLLKLVNGDITYAQYSARMGRNEDELNIDDFDEKRLEEDSALKFDEELSQSRRDNLRGNLQGTSEGRARRKRRNLPPALQGLMGQANLCYARGEINLAEKLCLEIIRQEPLAYEPFISLAQIYEYKDVEKFLQFSLIAAYLNPGDVDQWTKIGDILVEQKNIKKAITCYTRGIYADPRNIDIRMRRIELLESIGEEKYAFRCRYALIPHVPPEQGEFLIQLAKKVAEKFHAEGNLGNALNAMEAAYDKVPHLFKVEDINLLLELMLENGAYKKVVNALASHTDVNVKTSEVDSLFTVRAISIPDDLILDFRSKLIVALIHLKSFHLLEIIMDDIFRHIDIEEAGDCYLDIAEALMKEEKFEMALQLLSPLVQSRNFSLAAVWLRHADCHRAIGDIPQAIRSYRQVINLAQHQDARLTLAALLKQKGDMDEALEVLKQDPETEVVNTGILYERCLLLKEVGYLDEYLDDGYLLVTRDCVKLRNRQEIQRVFLVKQHERVKEIKAMRRQKGEDPEDEVVEFAKSEMEPSHETEWAFLLDLVRTAYRIGRFEFVQKLTFTSMSSKRFGKHYRELAFHGFLGSYFRKDFEFAYIFVHDYLFAHPTNHKVWNLLNQILHFAENFRYHRFLFRLIRRNVCPPQVQIMQGNYFLMAGTYKYAMNEYVSLYKTYPRDPLVPLCIAVTLTQIASQKYSARKQTLVTQAMAYMEEYRKLRHPEVLHEIYYNFGRMFHQFGLISLALENYEKALEFDNELIRANPDHLSLRMQIAYNIYTIYLSSGNESMARKYLYEHIVI